MTPPGFGFSSISSISLDGLPFGNIPFSTYFCSNSHGSKLRCQGDSPDKNIGSGTEKE